MAETASLFISVSEQRAAATEYGDVDFPLNLAVGGTRDAGTDATKPVKHHFPGSCRSGFDT
jgi:hypothetical protein